jgi:hypothetical protein
MGLDLGSARSIEWRTIWVDFEVFISLDALLVISHTIAELPLIRVPVEFQGFE